MFNKDAFWDTLRPSLGNVNDGKSTLSDDWRGISWNLGSLNVLVNEVVNNPFYNEYWTDNPKYLQYFLSFR